MSNHKSGDVIVSTTRSWRSTRSAMKCSVLAKIAHTSWNQLNSVELSRKNDQIARSVSTRLVELSRIGRSEQGFRDLHVWPNMLC